MPLVSRPGQNPNKHPNSAPGIVTLAQLARNKAGRRGSGRIGYRIPRKQSTSAQLPMGACLQQVTAYAKEMLRQSVPREESLRLRRGFEPSHVALPLS